MKTELRLAAHQIIPGQNVFEIWYAGRLIGQVTGADGPGVRVISKYSMEPDIMPNPRVTPVHVIDIRIGG